VERKGLTGLIAFDNAGFRSNFELEIFKLTYSGIRVVGQWNSTKNIEWITDTSMNMHSESLSLRNTTFRILIALVSINIKSNYIIYLNSEKLFDII
jgi:hypothetical protein